MLKIQQIVQNLDRKNLYIGISAVVGLFSIVFIDLHYVLSIIFLVLGFILTHLIQLITSLLIAISHLLLPIIALIIAGVFSCPKEESFMPWFQNIIDYMAESELKEAKTYWDQARNYGFKFFINRKLTNSMKPWFFHIGFGKIVICTMEEENKKMLFLGMFNTWIPLREY